MIDIGQKRKEKNLTLEELGKKVGVSKGTVKKWESGYIKNMRRDKIVALAAALEISPLELLDVSTSSVSIEKVSRPLNDEYKDFFQQFFNTSFSENTILYCTDNNLFCQRLSTDSHNLLIKICEQDSLD